MNSSSISPKMGIIIQARIGSTRLPNKVIKPFFESYSILDIIIDKIKEVAPEGMPIVLATTNLEQDEILEKKALEHKIKCFRGNSEDVLLRFINAAEEYNIDKIIRVCGDNPFLDIKSFKNLIHQFSDSESDYLSFKVNNKPSILTHFGFWAEAISLDALKTVVKLTSEKLYHEHVTNYVYSHTDRFNVSFIPVDLMEFEKKIRLTIDTEEDYLISKEIYKALKSQHITETNDILELVCRNKEWLAVMRNQIIENSK